MFRSLIVPARLSLASLAALLPLQDATASRARCDEAGVMVEPARITAADHWTRVTSVLRSAMERLERIRNLHRAAARQLDSADYALTQLLQDLRPAMALPTDVSGLRAVLAEAERQSSARRMPYPRHGHAQALAA